MRTFLAGLLLGALLASPAVRANTVETDALSIGWLDGYYPIDLTVLSDSAGIIRIGLLNHGPLGISAYSTRTTDASGSWTSSRLNATVRDGYRITGMTYQALALGSYSMVMPPPCAACELELGYAYNQANLQWNLDRGQGPKTALPHAYVEWLQGSTTLQGHADVALEGSFLLELETGVHSSALASVQTVDGIPDYYFAWAAMGMGDLVLTFEVAPVPEPGTYALLFAGLAVLAVHAKRRVTHSRSF